MSQKDSPPIKTISSPRASRAWMSRASVLVEAMPYLRKYAGAWIVIKFGGHALDNNEQTESFAACVGLLKLCGVHVVIVHGGAPQINRLLDRMGVKPHFVNGLRITDQNTMQAAQMALCGEVNPALVAMLNRHGCRAVGICGKDDNLLQARKVDPLYDTSNTPTDLGFVGDPAAVNVDVLVHLSKAGFIPVVAPIASDIKSVRDLRHANITLNVNADTAAGAIASALKAMRFILLTDVAGVAGSDGQLIEHLNLKAAEQLLNHSTAITGGMRPKLATCINSVRNGVDAAVIIDGREPMHIMLELFTHNGAGTLIDDHDNNSHQREEVSS